MQPSRHTPRKRFGQHFLHDPGILRKIVQAIAAKAGDNIVEIGHLTAIELDRDLVPRLRAAAEGVGELDVVNADVLTVDFSALAAKGPLRIVGNLPYNISSPILFHCIEHIDAIRDMHFMLQKEVVERMAAAPGSKVYGRLSVMLQLVCRVDPLLRVPAGAFRPPPKVESAVVRLTPRAPAERRFADAPLLARIVKAAFGQRRKTLANALGDLADAEKISEAGIDPRSRAEQLAPAAFVALAQIIGGRQPVAGSR